MWREVLITAVGIWLLIFSALEIEEINDSALTILTAIIVLILGGWGIISKIKKGPEAPSRPSETPQAPNQFGQSL